MEMDTKNRQQPVNFIQVQQPQALGGHFVNHQ